MIITNSPDISVLLVKVVFDISGDVPVISLTNLSQGSNLQGCSWAFSAYSPTKSPIHQGDINNPDITPQGSAWTTFSITDDWDKNPFNPSQILWSGAPYIFYVTVKDSVGNVYSTMNVGTQFAGIVPPPNVTDYHEGYFGIASSVVQTKCNDGAVYFQDETDTNYQGSAGVIVSSTLEMTYPPDKTGATQTPFSLINYSSALVPVTQNSPSYVFTQNSIYEYDLGNNTFVRIKYYLQASFGVWCGIDLLPLQTIINKYSYKVANNEFQDMASAQKKSLIILFEYQSIITGMLQPLSGGIDIPYRIRRIEELTGFKCFDACCGAKSGIIGQVNSVIGGYNFVVNKLGGDIHGNVTQTGNNIVFNLADVTYIIDVTQNSPSDITAFAFVPELTGDGYTKYFHLQVDVGVLANELATIIGNNAELLNQWQALFAPTTNNNNNVLLDGGSVFTSSNTANYTFTLSGIPATNPNFAILGTLKYGNVPLPINLSFNLTTLGNLQTQLNSLGLGTCIVTDLGVGGGITIEFDNNTNDFLSLTYSIAGVSKLADLNKVVTGYSPITIQQALQDIIYYVSSLNDSQIQTSQNYQIISIDNTTGAKTTTTVIAGTELSSLIAQILELESNTVDYTLGLGAVNCQSVQALFPTSSKILQANDFLDGTKGGQCAKVYPAELFLAQLNILLASKDAATLSALQSVLNLLQSGVKCQSFVISVGVTPYSTSCPYIYDLPSSKYSLGSTSITITGVMFANTPSTGQSISVYYRVHNTGSYTLAATETTDTAGNLSPSIVISGLTNSTQYDIQIVSNCSSPSEFIIKTLTTNP